MLHAQPESPLDSTPAWRPLFNLASSLGLKPPEYFSFVCRQRPIEQHPLSGRATGVNVPSGTRWSWVLWFKDGGDCTAADPTAWHRRPAEDGDAVAQFLHAHRLHQFGVPPSRTAGNFTLPSTSATNMPAPPQGGEYDVDPQQLQRGEELAAWRLRQRAEWLRRAAEGGFSRAQNELGNAYNTGEGVPMDTKLARQWFEAAARSGQEPDARYNLGLLLLQSGESEARAVGLFRKAAQQGSTEAMYNLGVAYHKGAGGLARDLGQAARYFEMSGDADGLYLAATIHEQAGRSTEASRLLLLAARAGHITAGQTAAERAITQPLASRGASAAALAGDVDGDGDGSGRYTASEEEAEKWLLRSLHAGNLEASSHLARLYADTGQTDKLRQLHAAADPSPPPQHQQRDHGHHQEL